MSILQRFFAPRLPPTGVRSGTLGASCAEASLLPVGNDGVGQFDLGPALSALGNPRNATICARMQAVFSRSNDGSPVLPYTALAVVIIQTDAAGNVLNTAACTNAPIIAPGTTTNPPAFSASGVDKLLNVVWTGTVPPFSWGSGRMQLCLGPINPTV